ncbi:MAG TPA: hypothetical protein VJU82_02200 [Acidobacteriaceae bacterium]|nr:hypothetical protein [Acidobacteriaceae bacterium]
MKKQWVRTFCAAAILAISAPCAFAAKWIPVGPEGGDARAFAIDPTDHNHVYLGTATGWLYQTHDGGVHWERMVRLANRDDLVIDHILVDQGNPKHLVIGAWALSDKPDGGIYESHDSGMNWTAVPEMAKQSVRALTGAPSDPKVMVAGTLEGVFRSEDTGAHWQRISPPENKEIHEIESIAIDPVNPKIIYAGTWHLPWKTTDGGGSWSPMTQGIITDSDVFSIIVDPKAPSVLYLSACSGIYKSVDAGASFKGGVGVNKGQGIPATARRTRVLMQDPNAQSVVYAGTTEGLWRTDDAGAEWKRKTGSSVIVNAVLVDPTNSKRVMLATDRGGVLMSHDGGNSFEPSNAGFSERQISAFTEDPKDPAKVFIGVVNDKELGGVFESKTGGTSWQQVSAGLEGRDVYSLAETPNGTPIAGTSHGIFLLKDGVWKKAPASLVPPPAPRKQPVSRKGSAAKAAPVRAAAPAAKPAVINTHIPPGKSFDGPVFAFASSGNRVFAATSRGLLGTTSEGAMWNLVGGLPATEWRFVSAEKDVVAVANLSMVKVSTDGGETWQTVNAPPEIHMIEAVAVDGDGRVWAGGRQGAFYTADQGATWTMPRDLYARNINSLYFDPQSQRLLLTTGGRATEAFAVELPSMKVKAWDTGWKLRLLRPVGDHFAAATLFDGMIVQPKMIDSAQAGQ